MLHSQYKESRIASIEMLFGFFKNLPTSYYVEKSHTLENGLIETIKDKTISLKKSLDINKTGFDYIEITGVYLCAYDQKILRAILQTVYKAKESLYTSDSTTAVTLNKEYMPVTKEIYSNKQTLKIKDFYELFTKANNRSNKIRLQKISNSLQRLAHTILTFSTNDRNNVITAPLLIYSNTKSEISFQVHPAIMSFNFETLNDTNLLKYQQDFYLLDNTNIFKKMSNLQQLIYSKIQYKFASMSSKYKYCEIDIKQLLLELYLPTTNKQTNKNRTSDLKKHINSLNNMFEYHIELNNKTRPTFLKITKKFS